MSLTVTGLPALLAKVAQLEATMARLSRNDVLVGTDMVYARGQETGFYRSGRLARRAGGAFFMQGALSIVGPTIAPAINAVIFQGPEAVERTLLAKGKELAVEAQARAPVLSGNLRQSIHTETAPR
ncbi:MAG TPA: hypothetical protein VIU62_18915 [Chloroflexota bacterium]